MQWYRCGHAYVTRVPWLYCTVRTVRGNIEHWNGNLIILMKFSSLVAPDVILTTSGAASEENFIKMTTFLLQQKSKFFLGAKELIISDLMTVNSSCSLYPGKHTPNMSQIEYQDVITRKMLWDTFSVNLLMISRNWSCNECDYLSMMRLKLIHVSERGPMC